MGEGQDQGSNETAQPPRDNGLDGLVWERAFPYREDAPPRERDALILRADGTEKFRLNGVKAPAWWGDLAIDIAAQKYFIRKGAQTPSGRETSIYEMMSGVASTIAAAGRDYFADTDSQDAFEADLTSVLLQQIGAFNSPVWFNVRHSFVHGISSSGGNWAWGYGVAKEVANGYARPQSSACFITPIRDSLVGPAGIAQSLLTEFRVFKRGSGVGSNFSTLREKDAPLSAGGGSSGVLSFLEVFDKAAGATKSGGTTRRAAKMVILDADHPDIEAFISWKVREEKKAQALIAAGYDGGMEGEAYLTVSGQNANNSVRVTDQFMHAVVDDKDWQLVSRVDNRPVRTVKARALWRQIAEASHFVGDPGLQFDTTINHWHTTPNAGRINASNPCSEFMYLDNSACNLASIRLTKFLRPDGNFDVQGFIKACELFIIAQEILVDYSSYPTKELAEGAHKFRPLGLGYADLGALLMLLGVPYDSNAGRAVAAALTSLMTAAAYRASAWLAQTCGPFEGFAADRGNVLRVIDMHAAANDTAFTRACHLTVPALVPALYDAARAAWQDAQRAAQQYGVRNAQVTLLAPTGTIGFLMGCTTTGVEPLLAHLQFKKLAGGGYLSIVNDVVAPSLRNLGYAPQQVQEITAYVQEHGYFTGAPGFLDAHLPIFDTANPAAGDPARRYLSPEAHIWMLGAVQPFLSGAISKTVNLPNEATVEDVERLHMLAWTQGLKAVALYRDGCKQSQPVSSQGPSLSKASGDLQDVAGALQAATHTFQQTATSLRAAPDPAFKQAQRKLPKVRRGLTWALKLDEHKIYIRSGEYVDGTLGEVFIDLAKEGSTLGGLVGMWAKALSLALQYGTPLEELVETFTFTRFEPFGIVQGHPTIRMATSIVDVVMRTLAVHYLGRTDLQHVQPEALAEDLIPPPAHAPAVAATAAPPVAGRSGGLTAKSGDGPACPECGTITQRNATCYRCPNCGASLGCS